MSQSATTSSVPTDAPSYSYTYDIQMPGSFSSESSDSGVAKIGDSAGLGMESFGMGIMDKEDALSGGSSESGAAKVGNSHTMEESYRRKNQPGSSMVTGSLVPAEKGGASPSIFGTVLSAFGMSLPGSAQDATATTAPKEENRLKQAAKTAKDHSSVPRQNRSPKMSPPPPPQTIQPDMPSTAGHGADPNTTNSVHDWEKRLAEAELRATRMQKRATKLSSSPPNSSPERSPGSKHSNDLPDGSPSTVDMRSVFSFGVLATSSAVLRAARKDAEAGRRAADHDHVDQQVADHTRIMIDGREVGSADAGNFAPYVSNVGMMNEEDAIMKRGGGRNTAGRVLERERVPKTMPVSDGERGGERGGGGPAGGERSPPVDLDRKRMRMLATGAVQVEYHDEFLINS